MNRTNHLNASNNVLTEWFDEYVLMYLMANVFGGPAILWSLMRHIRVKHLMLVMLILVDCGWRWNGRKFINLKLSMSFSKFSDMPTIKFDFQQLQPISPTGKI
jgi:hypothetical protein